MFIDDLSHASTTLSKLVANCVESTGNDPREVYIRNKAVQALNLLAQIQGEDLSVIAERVDGAAPVDIEG